MAPVDAWALLSGTCANLVISAGNTTAVPQASSPPAPQTLVISRVIPGAPVYSILTIMLGATSVPHCRLWLAAAAVCAFLSGAATAAEDPGARALQQHQLQRQQQQDSLQLRMHQQQRALQTPPAGARQQQAVRQLEIEQQQRQQELHYRQGTEPSTAQPTDDEGTRRAKARMDLQKAQQQGARQLQRFERDAEQEAQRRRKVESRGEIIPPEER
jgi:hypothetical protein